MASRAAALRSFEKHCRSFDRLPGDWISQHSCGSGREGVADDSARSVDHRAVIASKPRRTCRSSGTVNTERQFRDSGNIVSVVYDCDRGSRQTKRTINLTPAATRGPRGRSEISLARSTRSVSVSAIINTGTSPLLNERVDRERRSVASRYPRLAAFG